ERRKLGRTPHGHRLVEVLNVGSIAGLSVATAAYFWFNRLIPADMAGRSDWEIRGFFIVWLLCLIHPLLRPHRKAWYEQLALAVLLFALLPVLNLLTGGASLAQTLTQGQWSIAGFDLMMLALALMHAVIVWWLLKPATGKTVPTRSTAVAQAKESANPIRATAAAAHASMEQTS
ncbi:MAG: PepSY domain-containing protein, partial [Comamonas sp.]